MALRSTIVYPLGTIAVQMGAPENLALLRAHEEPGLGVAARVHERINLPGDTLQVTLQGLRRIIIDEVPQIDPYPVAIVRPAKDVPADPAEVTDLITRVATAAQTLAEMVDRIPDEVPA